jgi:hypothetical protein
MCEPILLKDYGDPLRRATVFTYLDITFKVFLKIPILLTRMAVPIWYLFAGYEIFMLLFGCLKTWFAGIGRQKRNP